MGKVVIGMTVSIDGFVEDQSGSVARLYPDLADLRNTAYMQDLIKETGAVLMGKRAFEMGDPGLVRRELRVPGADLRSHHNPPPVPPKQDEHLTFTFVTDGVESAVAQATAAAGDKTVQ